VSGWLCRSPLFSKRGLEHTWQKDCPCILSMANFALARQIEVSAKLLGCLAHCSLWLSDCVAPAYLRNQTCPRQLGRTLPATHTIDLALFLFGSLAASQFQNPSPARSKSRTTEDIAFSLVLRHILTMPRSACATVRRSRSIRSHDFSIYLVLRIELPLQSNLILITSVCLCRSVHRYSAPNMSWRPFEPTPSACRTNKPTHLSESSQTITLSRK